MLKIIIIAALVLSLHGLIHLAHLLSTNPLEAMLSKMIKKVKGDITCGL